MKVVTRILVDKFDLIELKYDFMGFYFKNTKELSFHHLIFPSRYCKDFGLGDGLFLWNGAILVRKTAHDYLHIIEKFDIERFYAITRELVKENVQGYLDYKNLKEISDILSGFEKEYSGNGIIKESFTRRLIK